MATLDDLDFDALVPSESKYLRKEDVGTDGVILTIKGFSREVLESDGNQETKTILHFVEPGYKAMVLNRTNSQLIPICTGAHIARDAKGKKIVVYNDPTIGFGGKITGGLRIRKVGGQPKAPAVAEPFDDSLDVPF